MAFKIDGTQAGTGALPVGEYECFISEVKVGNAQQSGNEMIKVTLTVRDDVEQGGQKRKLFDNMVFTEAAMFKFHQVGKALGVDGVEFDDIADFAKVMHGRAVRVKTGQREYGGEMQTTVKTYLESSVGGNFTPSSHDPFGGDNKPLNIKEDDLPF